MERPGRHLSRPLYEGLPWIYMVSGILALVGSYWIAAHGTISLIVGLFGLVALVGGFVVLLRRRDYRQLRSQYADPDSLTRQDKP
jgi:membrane associated rhomboid family serine protease